MSVTFLCVLYVYCGLDVRKHVKETYIFLQSFLTNNYGKCVAIILTRFLPTGVYILPSITVYIRLRHNVIVTH